MKAIKFNPGDIIGHLTILESAGSSDHGDRLYRCKCKCGNEVIKKATIIRTINDRGQVCSCGCRRKNKIC